MKKTKAIAITILAIFLIIAATAAYMTQTPNSQLSQEALDWQIKVTGNLADPLTLTGENVTLLQPQTIHGEFRPGDAKNRTSDWTGIPLTTILHAANPSTQATKVSIIGNDNYTKAFTLDQIRSGNILLGYLENGKPLPTSEGGPFRLFAPSDSYKWGQYWVKYVVEIRVT
jgi:DMSO/TMAO reductase YedYZ molybdopterin-dependent catalytic subunit